MTDERDRALVLEGLTRGHVAGRAGLPFEGIDYVIGCVIRETNAAQPALTDHDQALNWLVLFGNAYADFVKNSSEAAETGEPDEPVCTEDVELLLRRLPPMCLPQVDDLEPVRHVREWAHKFGYIARTVPMLCSAHQHECPVDCHIGGIDRLLSIAGPPPSAPYRRGLGRLVGNARCSECTEHKPALTCFDNDPDGSSSGWMVCDDCLRSVLPVETTPPDERERELVRAIFGAGWERRYADERRDDQTPDMYEAQVAIDIADVYREIDSTHPRAPTIAADEALLLRVAVAVREETYDATCSAYTKPGECWDRVTSMTDLPAIIAREVLKADGVDVEAFLARLRARVAAALSETKEEQDPDIARAMREHE